jgi:hypothetical protein
MSGSAKKMRCGVLNTDLLQTFLAERLAGA